MSRPPGPRADRSPGGSQPGAPDELDYLPLDYAGLLALVEEHAIGALGRAPAQAGAGPAAADITRTMMELSALAGHVLSVYQRRYAREAFISTATAPSSLLRQAERLGYQPDPGVAATGHVVLFTKPGVSGVIPARQPLATTPLGELTAQDYELLDDTPVDAALNQLEPADAMEAAVPSGHDILLQGTGLGIKVGDVAAVPPVMAFMIAAVTEQGDNTRITADRGLFPFPAGPLTLLAQPRRVMRSFGATADPLLFPPDRIVSANGTEPANGNDGYWYTVTRPDDGGFQDTDIYLAEVLPDSLMGQVVVRRATADGLALFRCNGQSTVTVTLNRRITETYPTQTVTVTPKAGGGFDTTPTATTGTQVTGGHISGTVSAIQLIDSGGYQLRLGDSAPPSEWLADWQIEAPLALTTPSTQDADTDLVLNGVLPGLTPGRLLAFTTRDQSLTQIVTVRRAVTDTAADKTKVTWDAAGPAPARNWVWPLGDLLVLGNVARISHGKSVEETLGGSDGVSPFQSFTLKKSPVTVLPAATGGEPALDLRVGGVLWSRVTDFADSGPDDRHYRAVAEPDGSTTVLFGDGQHGAVPPSGRTNVTAVYRVGLGQAGNAGPGRVSRIKRSHPLLDRAVNLTPVTGGADPAPLADVRTVATRWIRTFDRAVSVDDLADLALSFPGIARSAASFAISSGISLVVATADGSPPSSTEPIRAFLDARRDTSIRLRFADPEPLDLAIVLRLTTDPAYLVDAVRDAVRDALHSDSTTDPGMFTFPARDLGQPAFLSELYARVEAVPGVIAVQVSRFSARGPSDVADQIPAQPHEWLRLLPNDLDLT
jgi:hypothetical protein